MRSKLKACDPLLKLVQVQFLTCLKPYLHIASKIPLSKLHLRFIEASSNFSWSCTKVSMMALIFRGNIPFAIFFQFKINLNRLSSKLHRHFIEKFVHGHEKFDEASMKRR